MSELDRFFEVVVFGEQNSSHGFHKLRLVGTLEISKLSVVFSILTRDRHLEGNAEMHMEMIDGGDIHRRHTFLFGGCGLLRVGYLK